MGMGLGVLVAGSRWVYGALGAKSRLARRCELGVCAVRFKLRSPLAFGQAQEPQANPKLYGAKCLFAEPNTSKVALCGECWAASWLATAITVQWRTSRQVTLSTATTAFGRVCRSASAACPYRANPPYRFRRYCFLPVGDYVLTGFESLGALRFSWFVSSLGSRRRLPPPTETTRAYALRLYVLAGTGKARCWKRPLHGCFQGLLVVFSVTGLANSFANAASRRSRLRNLGSDLDKNVTEQLYREVTFLIGVGP
jgi:hypothetical protein